MLNSKCKRCRRRMVRRDRESRLYSTFSLRPPLPPTSSTFGKPNIPINNGNGNAKILSSARQRQSPSPSPSPSFLFRMYVACHVLRVATETRFTALVLLHRYAQAKQEAAITTNTTTKTKPKTKDRSSDNAKIGLGSEHSVYFWHARPKMNPDGFAISSTWHK